MEILDSITVDFLKHCCYNNELWIVHGENFDEAMMLIARSNYDEEQNMKKIE